MTRTKGAMRWGAVFIAVSAALHVLALVVGNFSSEALALLPVGIIYAGIAYGLLRGWRWLAYIAFIVVFFAMSIAISNIWAYGDVPGWLYAGIAIADGLAIVALFVALWKSPEMAAS